MLNCFQPLDPAMLSCDDRHKAHSSLLFLTKKHSGKARECAEGCKQREHISKDEFTSPTVSTDAIFIMSTIAAHERWDVTSVDILCMFLHVDNDAMVTMRLDGILTKTMAKIAPELYCPFIMTTPNRKPVICVTCQSTLRATQGCSPLVPQTGC